VVGGSSQGTDQLPSGKTNESRPSQASGNITVELVKVYRIVLEIPELFSYAVSTIAIKGKGRDDVTYT
jgi:hypothetical protein